MAAVQVFFTSTAAEAASLRCTRAITSCMMSCVWILCASPQYCTKPRDTTHKQTKNDLHQKKGLKRVPVLLAPDRHESVSQQRCQVVIIAVGQLKVTIVGAPRQLQQQGICSINNILFCVIMQRSWDTTAFGSTVRVVQSSWDAGYVQCRAADV